MKMLVDKITNLTFVISEDSNIDHITHKIIDNGLLDEWSCKPFSKVKVFDITENSYKSIVANSVEPQKHRLILDDKLNFIIHKLN